MADFNLSEAIKSRKKKKSPGRKDKNRNAKRFSGSNKRAPNRRDSSRLEMTKVTCDSCKEKCEVPFKPTSNKPIYCENCFKKDSSPRSSSRSGPRASSNSNDLSKEIKKINKKLDIILKALKLE